MLKRTLNKQAYCLIEVYGKYCRELEQNKKSNKEILSEKDKGNN